MLTTFFILLAFLMFYIAVKGYLAKNKYGGSSAVVCGIIYLILGLYNLFIGLFPFPLTGYMVWWIGMVFIAYLCFALGIKKIIKKITLEELDSNIKTIKKSHLRKYVESITKENHYVEKITVKMELIRKSFHLTGLLFFLCYFGFFFISPLGTIINDTVIVFIKEIELLYNSMWGNIRDYPYEKGDFQAIVEITMFGLIATMIFLITADLIRILWGPEYSIFNYLTKSILRKKEIKAFGAHIYLISGSIIAYLLYMTGWAHVLTVTSAILIACFSDALAAVIGRKYGKHKVKCIGGDIKSIEGFIAGTGSAFIFCLILIGPIYALIAALIFFLLDFFPTIISDNILNPILITIFVTFSIIFLGLPIGWF